MNVIRYGQIVAGIICIFAASLLSVLLIQTVSVIQALFCLFCFTFIIIFGIISIVCFAPMHKV